MIVAERVHADPGDEVEIPRAVVGDELDAFPSHEQGADAGVDVEQCGRRRQGRRARGNGGHAGWTAGARIPVPARGSSRRCRSPKRTARAPAPPPPPPPVPPARGGGRAAEQSPAPPPQPPPRGPRGADRPPPGGFPGPAHPRHPPSRPSRGRAPPAVPLLDRQPEPPRQRADG